jgi:peptidoglycan/xylan/chitin deacetylase (PgdA/CDA1 family)
MEEIITYKDFLKKEPFALKFRNQVRNAMILGLSLKNNIKSSDNWVRFPYYHHVFDDEKKGFHRQLKYLMKFGDFIDMESACKMISGNEPINGRYFCVSFDDGFENCFTNMMDITVGLDIPVIIYLPTNYIGLNIQEKEGWLNTINFYPESPKLVPFLNWEECKKMLLNKITFGSHTVSHMNLVELNEAGIENELKNSKLAIEQNLGVPCNHFACPWGKPGINFFPATTLPIAKKLGYTSFATTIRGKMQKHDDLYMLKRDHVIAGWENFQLKYFFGQ